MLTVMEVVEVMDCSMYRHKPLGNAFSNMGENFFVVDAQSMHHSCFTSLLECHFTSLTNSFMSICTQYSDCD